MISPDGRYVAFLSRATDLVPGFVNGNNGSYDLYVRDLQKGTTKLITVNASGTASGNANENATPSALFFNGDGSTLPTIPSSSRAGHQPHRR